MVNLPLCSKQGNNGLKAKNFEKILFYSISKITRPVSHFWILPNAKLAKRAVECLNEQLRYKIKEVLVNKSNTPSGKRSRNHFRLQFSS